MYFTVGRSVTLSGLEVGSIRPLTGEVVDNFESALMDVRASRRVREQAYSVMGNVESLQQAAHRSVSDGITQKVAETVTLKVNCFMKRPSRLCVILGLAMSS